MQKAVHLLYLLVQRIFSSRWSIIILFSLLVFSMSLGLYVFPPAVPDRVVVDGLLDVSEVHDPLIPLSGTWRVEESSSGLHAEDAGAYAALPSTWSSSFGYARYSVHIAGLDSYAGGLAMLYVPYMGTSYRISLNGREIASNGIAGKNMEQSEPKYLPMTVRLDYVTGDDILTLEVSNYEHRRGGAFQTIMLGDQQGISQFFLKKTIPDCVFVIIYTLVGGYFLLVALTVRQWNGLYLSLFYFSIACSGLFGTPSVLFLQIFPDFPWILFQKLCYSASYSVPIWLYLFINGISLQLPCHVSMLVVAPLLVSLCIVLIVPVPMFTRLNTVFQILTLLLVSFMFGILINDTRERKRFASTALVGHVVFYGIAVSAILFSNNRISGGAYLPLSSIGALFGSHDASQVFCIFDILSYLLMLVLVNVFTISYFHNCGIFSQKAHAFLSEQLPSDTGEGVPDRSEVLRSFGLTVREMDVAFLILQGKTNLEIADLLFISLSTVKVHVSHILQKTGSNNRTDFFFKLSTPPQA